MLELHRDELVFRFPEVHADAELRVSFQRTLRIPDDGKSYPLPPGLGRFPVKCVDEHKDRIPAKWMEHGGLMIPMYQSEALWICFHAKQNYSRASAYPFAVRVAAGKVNAVSGAKWKKKLHEGDYLPVPPQPWLDGFCVEKGKIRQFVAMPLGWGLSVEQQVTGKEEFGGLQIEVYPMKGDLYEQKFPIIQHKTGGGILRSCCLYDSNETSTMDYGTMERGLGPDMALGAGGLMDQQIFEDANGLDSWSKEKSRVFVHLTNSFSWHAITGHQPPTTPWTAADYNRHGLPWFEHYLDGVPIMEGGKNLKSIKSVLALGFQKGLGVLPENESLTVPKEKIKVIRGDRSEVRNGSW